MSSAETPSKSTTVRTIGDRLESEKHPEIGAVDPIAPWLDRNGAIVFDGTPLRDHPLDPPGPRAGEKEKLAMVLVACDVDREVASITVLPERHGKPTADFSAHLRDHREVRIELTSFRDDVATPYVGGLEKTFNALWDMRDADPELERVIAGRHFLFGFPSAAPRAADAKKAAAEVALILREVGRLSDADARGRLGLTHMLAAPKDCPVLASCGAWWSLRAVGQPEAKVHYTVATDIVDYKRVLASVPTVLSNKAKKVGGYSDNGAHPVWLAVFMGERLSYSPLTALQALRYDVPDIMTMPFERVLIGLMTAGIVLKREQPARSYYNSLSEHHGVVSGAINSEPEE